MQPDAKANPEYLRAFIEIAKRIARSLEQVPARARPVRMFVAGGAALHLYTGTRVSKDIDAVFSRRVALPEDLEVSYRDIDGAARLLYFDRQYNDTLGLMHEHAHADSLAVSLPGLDPSVLEVRLLAPVDLAVSKLGRFAAQDREDIATLARCERIDARRLRERAEQAQAGYVGDLGRIRGSIDIACAVVDDARRRVRAR
jgi:hypothetical protein